MSNESDLSAEVTICCEIYENERFAPFKGFSSQGLLPTDRKHISTEDGSLSYVDLPELTSQLLTPGWEWDDGDWVVGAVEGEPGETPDSSGWLYAVDFAGPAGFSKTNQGSTAQKHIHFVRRRALMRFMKYHAERLFETQSMMMFTEHPTQRLMSRQTEPVLDCHYDQRLLDDLSAHLLVSLCSVVSVEAASGWSLSIHLAKNDFVKFILNMPDTHKFDVEAVKTAISEYAHSQRPQSGFLHLHSSGTETIARSESQLSRVAEQFPAQERAGLARLLVYRADGEATYHCTPSSCAKEECPFALMRCAHEGCGVSVSRKYSIEHDEMCTFKVVPCTLHCDHALPRHAMEHHVHKECSLRPVICPFAQFGCEAEGLRHKDLAGHEQEEMALHLALTLSRVRHLEASKREADLKIEQLTMQIHNMNRR